MHCLKLFDGIPFFPGEGISVLQIFVSCEIPQSFLRHETFHFKLIQKPLTLFSGDSPRGSEFVLTCCRTLLCPLAPACSTSSIFVPFSASHNPSISCTKSEPLPAYLFFLPNRDLQGDAFFIFKKIPTRILVLCIFLASSCTCYLFHTSCIDTPFDVLSPQFSDPQNSTFLLASA